MPEQKPKKRSYPALYEKIIPIAIAGLVLLLIVVLAVIFIVLLRA